MTDARQVPDIERAALAMLARAQVTHPVLRAWVVQIVNDPTFAGSLDDQPAIDLSSEPGTWVQPGPDGRLYTALLDHRAFRHTEYEPASERRRRALDEATAKLAHGVVQFRRDGRPAGDVSVELRGLGGSLGTITTSLAAKVAEYAQAIADAWSDFAYAEDRSENA